MRDEAHARQHDHADAASMEHDEPGPESRPRHDLADDHPAEPGATAIEEPLDIDDHVVDAMVADVPHMADPQHLNEPPRMGGEPPRMAEPPRTAEPQRVPEPQRVDDRAPDGAPDRQQEIAPPPAEWPIQPLSGEPPLTLFRGKRMLELQPGTELDRFGGPEGNLTYVAGTPFEQRSLVPEWVHRPYHLYRVTRPLQALTGGAIPWFDQPGGGTAYLLPRAIEELVGAGDLVEVEHAEPPVS